METVKTGRTNMLRHFSGKTIAILGYREDGGKQQAQFLRENGIKVIIGLREEDEVWADAVHDGFPVFNVWDAVKQVDIAQVWQ